MALQGHWRGSDLGQARLIAVWQRLDHAHRQRKQVASSFGLARLGLPLSLLGLRKRMGGLDFLLDFFQVLQRVEFHTLPRLRIQSAV